MAELKNINGPVNIVGEIEATSLDVNGNADISGTTALGGKMTITTTSDSKLNLRVSSGDNTEWNYIDFTGSNGTRDAFFGIDSDGDPQWYRDGDGVYIRLDSSKIYASHMLQVNGELEATSLDINGNADISGTLDVAGDTTIANGLHVHHDEGIEIGDTGNNATARTTLTSFNVGGNARMKIKGGNWVHSTRFETSKNDFQYAEINSSYNGSDSTFNLYKSNSDTTGTAATTTISTGASTFAGDVRLNSGELFLTEDGSARKPVRLYQSGYKGAIALERDGTGTVRITGAAEIGDTYFNATNVNIGIGTTTPSAKLDVVGEVQATSLDINGNADISGNLTMSGNANLVMGTGQLKFADGGDIYLGDSNDLKIYHDGSNSYIEDSGTGNLKIRTSSLNVLNAANSEVMLEATENGAVTLYYDNALKLTTASGGVTVTGNVIATDGSDTATLKFSGLVLSRSNSYIQSNADNSDTLNIGQSSVRWGHVKVDSATFKVLNGGNERFGIDSSGNATFASNITLGSGSTENRLRTFYSDNSYTDVHGYGLFMSRGSSYIRPTADGTQTLYVGASSYTWDNFIVDANNVYFQKDGTNMLTIGPSQATFAGVLDITNTTEATDSTGDTGALRVEGGISSSGHLYAKGLMSRMGRAETNSGTNKIYPLGHYTTGKEVFSVDPTWTEQQLQEYFDLSSTQVAWATESDAPAGWSIRFDGGIGVGYPYSSGVPLIPIDDTSIYFQECYIKNVGTDQTHYMGSAEKDENFANPSTGQGNTGTFGYHVMANFNPGNSWTRVTGYITGRSDTASGAFETDANYFSPLALFNYGAGSGTRACIISGWRIIKIDKQEYFNNGTASEPAITNYDDPDTGIYWNAANELSLTTGGTNRMTINATGATFADKIGIGTAPSAPLHIAGTSGSVAGSAILFNGSTAIWQPSDATLTIRPSGTDAVTFSNTTATFAGNIDFSNNKGLTWAGSHSVRVESNILKLNASGGINLQSATSFTNTLTVGVDDTGYDVKFYGATTSRFLHWDESQDYLLFRDNVKGVFGNGGDLKVYHDSSNSYIENGTGTLYVMQRTNGADMSFQCDAGDGTDAEYFRLDGGDVKTIVSKPFRFVDSIAAEFGTGSDVTMKFDGSDLVTTVPTGSAFLIGTNGGTPNDNSGNADFVVDINTNPQLSLWSGQAMFGGTNMNWEGKFGVNSSNLQMGAWNRDIIIYNQGSAGATTKTIFIKAQADDGGYVTRAEFSGDNGTILTGATKITGTFQVGVNDTGHDVTFYGATSGKHMHWDEDSNGGRLNLNGGADLYINQGHMHMSQGSYYFKNASTGTQRHGFVADGQYAFENVDLRIQATQKLYLDGGSNTYITESSADVISFYRGGSHIAYMDSAGIFSLGNVYTGNSGAFRNYGGTWSATTGLTGNGFTFANSVDGTAMTLSSTGNAVFTGDITCGDDLFMPSAGVINFNNGDVTVTHSSNTLTIAGGNLIVPNFATDTVAIVEDAKSTGPDGTAGDGQAPVTITGAGAGNESNVALKLVGTIHGNAIKMKMVSENASGNSTGAGILSYEPDDDEFNIGQSTTHGRMGISIGNTVTIGSSDVIYQEDVTIKSRAINMTANANHFEFNGDIIKIGDDTTTRGKLYNYKNGTWTLADKDAEADADGLLAMAVGTNSTTHGMLLRGTMTLDYDPGAAGDVLYVGDSGAITNTAPSASGDIIRIVGYLLAGTHGNILFDPDKTFVEVA